MHTVLLPHMPLVVATRGPVGIGIVDVVVLVGGMTGVVLVLVMGGRTVVEVVLGGGIDVVVDEVVGCAGVRGHPQTPYCGWQSNRGWQWSIESPQKP